MLTDQLIVSPAWDEVFAHRVNMDGDCWTWTRGKNVQGYGYLRLSRKQGGVHWYAHRLSYTLAKGGIPDGLSIDHTCYTPLCVRPEHLRALTYSRNAQLQRSVFANTCGAGHVKTPVSFIRVCEGFGHVNGVWRCRVCFNLIVNRRYGKPDSSMCMLCGHQVRNHRRNPGCDHCACDGSR